jgi:PIN domain nuclease of toxin-antitoxin system
MIQAEPGGERVDLLLDQADLGADLEISICAVNWSEILARLQRDRIDITGDWLASVLPGVEVVPFAAEDAESAAAIARRCPSLSLGDRACLALAQRRNATAWTADKNWAEMNHGVTLEILR